jgi:hypothetical protein
MTEKQLKTAKNRIQEEVRLYAPNAELVLSGFPVFADGFSNQLTT